MKLDIFVSRYLANRPLGIRYIWYIFNSNKIIDRGMIDMSKYNLGTYKRTFNSYEEAYNYAIEQKEQLLESAKLFKL